ncbi:HAD family hydrolase [Haloparvum sedimenti]|uniref:HAD family hydrolase n=1 Tax=Haloparvum sedimenti TaxID=1678448 RepID=UPI00071E8607|nr:HAD family hydrolase [Haloparvum sedimenti]
MYDAILFDMDGVLLVGAGTDPGVYRMAAHDALREVGVDPPTVSDGHAETLEAVHYSDEMATACDALDVDRDRWWAARERNASRRTNARVRSGARRRYDDVAALPDLASDRRLGLVSNNRHATAAFVADFCFPGVFEAVVGREPTVADYRRRKPEPTLIDRGLGTMEATAGLYVGDRETDVVAAERAGLDTAFVERPHNESSDLDADPTIMVESLYDLRDRLER